MKLKIVFLSFLCLFFGMIAKGNKTISGNGTGITIGQKVPDVLVQKISGLRLNGKPVNQVQLSAFKGRLLVLDFWATNCGSCIRALPRLQKLQEEFNGRLQLLAVTYEQPVIVNAFLKHNELGRLMHLPIVMADRKLSTLFPHQLLSHEVWIDEQGIVRAITEAEYLDDTNIRQWLDHHSLNLPVKNDMAAFDYGQPLLSGNKSPAFYNAVFPFQPGVAPRFGSTVDSLNGTSRTYVVNFPLLQLYKLSVGHLLDLPQTMIRIAVRDTAMIYPPSGSYRSAWNQSHSWSYESVLPLNISDSLRNDNMRQALNSYFHLYGRMETRQARCLVLQRSPGFTGSLYTKGGIPLNTLHNADGVRMLTNASLSNIIWELNTIPGGLPALDRTGITANVDMQLQFNGFRDLISLNKALKAYGLIVKEETGPVTFFVLTDPPN